MGIFDEIDGVVNGAIPEGAREARSFFEEHQNEIEKARALEAAGRAATTNLPRGTADRTEYPSVLEPELLQQAEAQQTLRQHVKAINAQANRQRAIDAAKPSAVGQFVGDVASGFPQAARTAGEAAFAVAQPLLWAGSKALTATKDTAKWLEDQGVINPQYFPVSEGLGAIENVVNAPAERGQAAAEVIKKKLGETSLDPNSAGGKVINAAVDLIPDAAMVGVYGGAPAIIRGIPKVPGTIKGAARAVANEVSSATGSSGRGPGGLPSEAVREAARRVGPVPELGEARAELAKTAGDLARNAEREAAIKASAPDTAAIDARMAAERHRAAEAQAGRHDLGSGALSPERVSGERQALMDEWQRKVAEARDPNAVLRPLDQNIADLEAQAAALEGNTSTNVRVAADARLKAADLRQQIDYAKRIRERVAAAQPKFVPGMAVAEVNDTYRAKLKALEAADRDRSMAAGQAAAEARDRVAALEAERAEIVKRAGELTASALKETGQARAALEAQRTMAESRLRAIESELAPGSAMRKARLDAKAAAEDARFGREWNQDRLGAAYEKANETPAARAFAEGEGEPVHAGAVDEAPGTSPKQAAMALAEKVAAEQAAAGAPPMSGTEARGVARDAAGLPRREGAMSPDAMAALAQALQRPPTPAEAAYAIGEGKPPARGPREEAPQVPRTAPPPVSPAPPVEVTPTVQAFPPKPAAETVTAAPASNVFTAAAEAARKAAANPLAEVPPEVAATLTGRFGEVRPSDAAKEQARAKAGARAAWEGGEGEPAMGVREEAPQIAPKSPVPKTDMPVYSAAKEWFEAQKAKHAARDSVAAAFTAKNGEAPFEVPGRLPGGGNRPTQITVTRSTKVPGKWQVTFFDEKGPTGDTTDSFAGVLRLIQSEYGVDLGQAKVGKAAPVKPFKAATKAEEPPPPVNPFVPKSPAPVAAPEPPPITPAIRVDGKIFQGMKGQTHGEIAHPKPTSQLESGWTDDRTGKFMTDEEAADLVSKAEGKPFDAHRGHSAYVRERPGTPESMTPRDVHDMGARLEVAREKAATLEPAILADNLAEAERIAEHPKTTPERRLEKTREAEIYRKAIEARATATAPANPFVAAPKEVAPTEPPPSANPFLPKPKAPEVEVPTVPEAKAAPVSLSDVVVGKEITSNGRKEFTVRAPGKDFLTVRQVVRGQNDKWEVVRSDYEGSKRVETVLSTVGSKAEARAFAQAQLIDKTGTSVREAANEQARAYGQPEGGFMGTSISKPVRVKAIADLRAAADKAVAEDAAEGPKIAKRNEALDAYGKTRSDLEAARASRKDKGKAGRIEQAQAAVDAAREKALKTGALIQIDLGEEGRLTIQNTPAAIAKVLNRIEKPNERPPGVVGGGPLMAFGGAPVQAAIGAVRDAFKPAEPYPSSLPANLKTILDTTEAASPLRKGVFERVKSMAETTRAWFDEAADWASGVKEAPGLGDARGPDGKPLSLQVSAKVARGHQLDAPELAREAEARFYAPLRTNADLVLARRVIDYRDLLRMVEENEAGNPPKSLYGHTPEEIRAVLAEAEPALKANPAAQAMVKEFRSAADEIAADLRAMGYEASKRDWSPRRVIHDVEEPSGTGKTSDFKKRTPRSSLHRGGSEKFVDPDVGEGLYVTFRDVKQAKSLWDFTKKLQASENNLVPYLLEHGELPPGVGVNDVKFWSFERAAPDIAGVRAGELIKRLEDKAAQNALAAALGNPVAVKEVIHQYVNGRNRPYGLYKNNVIDLLNGMRPEKGGYGLGQAAIDLGHDLFRFGTLALRGGLGYEARNLGGDVGNYLSLASRWRDIPTNAAKGVANVLELGGRRLGEVVRGVMGDHTPDPVLEQARQNRSLQSGLFGSGGVGRRGILNRLISEKEGVRVPFRGLTPGGKVVRALENALGAPFSLIREFESVREAGTRETAVRDLMKQGYNHDAAVVLGNQVLVDYAMNSEVASAARKTVAPFIAWQLQTTANYLKNPVRSGKSVLSRIALAYGAINLYNWLKHPDQEKRLPPEIQAAAHVTTGEKDEKGRDVVIDLRRFGMEAPIPYRVAAWAVGKGLSTVFGEKLNRDLDRILAESGASASRDVLGVLGPLPSALTIGLTGVDPRTGEPIERRADEVLSPKERSEANLKRFGVPLSSTRAAAALSPFASPFKSFIGATQDDADKAEKTRARLLGNPFVSVEPGERVAALRRNERGPALHDLADALDAEESKDAEERAAARARFDAAIDRLVEMGVDGKEIKVFLKERANARARAALPGDIKRDLFNARNQGG